MPKPSRRAELLEELETAVLANTHASHDDPAGDEMADCLRNLWMCAVSTRFLERGSLVPKHGALDGIWELDPGRFRQETRLSPEVFQRVVRLIQHDNVFGTGTTKPQVPVAIQLAVTLHRLGCRGDGASLGKTATWAGVADDSVVNFTERVTTALVNIAPNHVRWYTDNELRVEMQENAASGFPECAGCLDGTDVVFTYRPMHDGDAYFSRKGRYGAGFLLVCDASRRIRYCFGGYPASSHDSRILGNCQLLSKISGRQYLLADSGFPLFTKVITSFRRPVARIDHRRSRFNYLLSQTRVRIEHTIGIWKARFPSLRGMPMQLTTAGDYEFAMRWVLSTIVLHNLCVDGCDEEWPVEPLNERPVDVEPELRDPAQGDEDRRVAVMDEALYIMGG